MKSIGLTVIALAALLLTLPGSAQTPEETPFTSVLNNSGDINAIAIDDNYIFTAQSGGFLSAVDRTDGSVLWSDRIYGPGSLTRNLFGIATSDNAVFIGNVFRSTNQDFSDIVASYDKQTGERLWQKTFSRPTDSGPAPEGVANARDALRLLADGDELYLGMDRGTIIKVNAHTGVAEWDTILPQVENLETANTGALAIDNQFLYIATNDNLGASPQNPNNRIHVLDRDSGTVLRSGYMNDGAALDSVVNSIAVSGGNLYAGMFGGRVLSAPAHDGLAAGDFIVGNEQLILDGEGPAARTPVSIVADESYLYTAHLGGWLYSFELGTLDPAWADNDNGNPSPKHVSNRHSRAVALSPDGDWIAQGFDTGIVAKISTEPGPVVEVRQPNGGEYLDGRANHALRWTMNDHHSNDGLLIDPYLVDVNFYLSDDNGANYATSPFLSIDEVAFTFNQLNSQIVFNTKDLAESDQYRLKIEVIDSDGYSSQDFSDGPFTIDRTAPVVNGVYPQPGTVINTDRPRFSVNYTDSLSGVDPNSVRFFINDETPRVPQTRGEQSAAFTWSSAFQLANGFHNARVEFKDMAGNPQSQSWSFRIDTVAPETPVSIPGRNTFTSNTQPELELRYLEPVHMLAATFGPSDGPKVDLIDKIQQPDVNRLRLRPAFALGEALEPGIRYEWSMTVRDDVGNQATTTLPFGVDVTGPQLSIQSLSDTPADGTVTGRSTIALVVKSTDNFAGIDPTRVGWTFAGKDRSGEVIVQADKVALVVKNLPSGVYATQVEVFDRAGNNAQFAWSFQVDVDAPVIASDLVLPGAQTAVKLGDSIRLDAILTDQDSVKKVEVDWGGLDDATGFVSADSLNAVTGQWESSAGTVVRETANRVAEIRVRATDDQGNARIETIPVIVDNVVPQAQMVPMAEFSGRSMSIEWSGSDGYGSVAAYDVQASVDDGPYNSVLTSTTELITTYSTPLDVAKLKFRVFATDHAGNRQTIPTPAVGTIVVGDVFSEQLVARNVILGDSTLMAATLATSVNYPVDDVLMTIRLVGSSANVTPEAMDRLDSHTYAKTWTPEDPGRYVLRFVARSPDGSNFESVAHFITVSELADVDGGVKESPGPVLIVPALALGAAWVRRRYM